MQMWHQNINQLGNDDEFCGTVCCIAGWVWADDEDNREIIEQTYRQAEQLKGVGSRVFWTSEIEELVYERIKLRHEGMDLSATSQQVSQFARQRLGLTGDQASQLFSCTYGTLYEDSGKLTNVWFHNREAIGLKSRSNDIDGEEVLPDLQDIELKHAVKLLIGLFMGDLHFPE
jgi:hypothetical protein